MTESKGNPQTAAGDQRKVLFVSLNPNLKFKTSEALLEWVLKDERLEVMMNSDTDRTFSEIRARGGAVVYYEVKSKEELIPLMRLVKEFLPQIKGSLIKVIGVLEFEANKIGPFLNKNGCPDILDSKVAGRTLSHKINRLVGVVAKSTASANQQRALTSQARASSAQTQEEVQKFVAPKIEWLPSLEERSDFFVLQKSSAVKRVLKRWLVSFVAPPPSQGSWEKIKVTGSVTAEAYFWRPMRDFSRFQQKAGRWIFYGKRPEYSASTGLWQFVGERPKLMFEPEGGGLSRVRFEGESHLLSIAQNAPYADEIIAAIRDLLNQEYKFNKDVPGAKGGGQGLDSKNGMAVPDLSISAEVRPERNLAGMTLDVEEETPAEAEDWSQILRDLGLVVFLHLNGKEIPCKIVDLFESEVTVVVSRSHAPQAGPIELEIRLNEANPKYRERFECELLEGEEAASEGDWLINLKVPDAQAPRLAAFANQFVVRQDSVSKFLAKARGD